MSEIILDERFDQAALDARLRWLNPPPDWSIDRATSSLRMMPAANTDFWQQTHYGFRADNGHLLFTEVSGDFTITTRVRFHPAHQYDQAGLMVRANALCWIKTSVEHELDGPNRLGVVVTNHGFSDWSMQDFPRNENAVWLRIRKDAQDFVVEFARGEGVNWCLLRVAHLRVEGGAALQCGLYACCPKGGSFRAEFGFLNIVRPAG